MTIDEENPAVDMPDYTELEAQYVPRFLALFARVDARQPHKGVRSLIVRARQHSLQSGMPLDVTLAQVYDEAVNRTERRLSLLGQCPLQPENQPER